MEYKVLKTHLGDKWYKEGSTRELREQDAKRLIAIGLLEDPNNPKGPDGHIPEDWKSLHADAMKALAKSLGGDDIKTKADAEAFIQLKFEDADEPTTDAKIEERDGKFVIVKVDETIGDPYDTKEAAEAALEALGTE